MAYVALCGPLIVLSMGCGVDQASTAGRGWAAGHGTPLFCHLI